MNIEFANETDFDINTDLILSLVNYSSKSLELDENLDLNILFVDEPTIENLHIKFLNLPGPTDVMSFPLDEIKPGSRGKFSNSNPGILGDIVLCPSFARKQALNSGHEPMDEYCFLILHGLLHLLGYDHALPDEKKEMFQIQKAIFLQWSAENKLKTEQTEDDKIIEKIEKFIDDF